MKKLAIIGTGNMGNALIEGMLSNNFIEAHHIHATRKNLNRIQHLKDRGVNVTQNNKEAVAASEIVIIAVKPYLVPSVLNEIIPAITSNHIIISIATSVTLKEMHDILGNGPDIFRAMPNTASSVGEGITCICAKDTSSPNLNLVNEIFNNLGESIVIEERLMDAATIIGACGVAFSLRFMRAMMQGAIEIGFDAKTAGTIVEQMVKGSAEILIKSGNHPELEIDKVTTPMGCTITGLNEMEHQGFSSALIQGIVASYNKIN